MNSVAADGGPAAAVFATPELLALILGCLPLRDRLVARRVCGAWRRARFAAITPLDRPALFFGAIVAIRVGDLAGLEDLLDGCAPAETACLPHGCFFQVACAAGRATVIWRLVARFGAAAEDVDAGFSAACAGGHLAAAQWVAGRVGLGTGNSDARDTLRTGGLDARDALIGACAGGHLATAQWLVGHFGLTGADAAHHDMLALRLARQKDHFDVVGWLVAQFRFSASQLVAAFIAACGCGQSKTAQWLAAQPRLAKAFTRTHALEALDGARKCGSGSGATARWLVRRFAVRPDHVHNTSTLQWLHGCGAWR